MKKIKHLQRSLIAMTFLSLLACNQGMRSSFTGGQSDRNDDPSEPRQLVDDLYANLACDNARGAIFDAYYKTQGDPKKLMKFELGKKLVAKLRPSNREASKLSLKSAVDKIHRIMTSDVEQIHKNVQMRTKSAKGSDVLNEDEGRDSLLHLIRLEMRSEVEPEYSSLNKELDKALAQAQVSARESELDCVGEDARGESFAKGTLENKGALWGALFTMATSYQSCNVLELPAMDESVANTQGIGTHKKIDRVGWGRKYENVDRIKQTHYYYRDQTYRSPCRDQSAKPLVYDYGGVPSIKSKDELDLFVNVGGGPALGIDCSAFVSTAVAAAGQLFKLGTKNKSVYTRFVSRDYINPSVSGWSCYESVKVSDSGSIEEGDIAAVKGHVVMIDEVGADPFGLDRISNINGCSSISYRDFDFSVIQSSPSKGSIGINRYESRAYLPESGKMRVLFEGYAQSACKSKFDKKVRVPVTDAYGIIRHKQTPECHAPRIRLVGESCISSDPFACLPE